MTASTTSAADDTTTNNNNNSIVNATATTSTNHGDDNNKKEKEEENEEVEAVDNTIIGVSTVGNRNRPRIETTVQEEEETKTSILLEDYLIADSEFFEQNTPRVLPEFTKEDINIGDLLGEGEFGTVCQINSFQKTVGGCGCYTSCGNRNTPNNNNMTSTEEEKITLEDETNHTKKGEEMKRIPLQSEAPIAEIPIVATANTTDPLSKSDDNDDGDVSDLDDDNDDDDDNGKDMDGEAEYMRDYLIHHVYRCGQYRYAIKQVRFGIQEDDEKMQAVIDMAMETKILSSIDHPNIVKVRAIMGTFGKPDDFGIIMDRLNDTLRDKIEHWALEEKKAKGSLMNRIVSGGRGDVERRDELLLARLYALYDIARALKYLHQKHILFRDLKPENVGVNLRGDYLIFDFGLAKELKRKDLIEPPDGFNATGLCGSRRYMAPEVVYCKNYGFSADVYSFSILFWETITSKVPFRLMGLDKHFEQVVIKGKRPERISNNKLPSKELHKMMEDGWAADPSQRPTFPTICDILKGEISNRHGHKGGGNIENRTNDLMNTSHVSRTESIKECC